MSARYLTDPTYKTKLLAAALDYANRGWRVFPLRPGTKKPATPNHPAHLCDHTDPKCADGHTGWEQRATTDPDRITKAWTTKPYGIGIACGPSRLLVIDLDTATDGGPSGIDTWTRLATPQPLDATYTVDTPSGGQHRYYRRPAGADLGNTASRIGARIDTRATGGYVVAPPTRTSDLTVYKTTCPRSPAPLPAWLLDALTQPTHTPTPRPAPVAPARSCIDASERVRAYVEAAVSGEIRRLAEATAPGNRNHTLLLASIALGQLVGARLLDQTSAEQTLWDACQHHIGAGAYTPNQATATIASGINRGIREPRTLPHNLTAEPAHV